MLDSCWWEMSHCWIPYWQKPLLVKWCFKRVKLKRNVRTKVLLRDRKRHTARHVTNQMLVMSGGYPQFCLGGGGWGTPWSCLDGLRGGYPLVISDRYPIVLSEGLHPSPVWGYAGHDQGVHPQTWPAGTRWTGLGTGPVRGPRAPPWTGPGITVLGTGPGGTCQ